MLMLAALGTTLGVANREDGFLGHNTTVLEGIKGVTLVMLMLTSRPEPSGDSE